MTSTAPLAVALAHITQVISTTLELKAVLTDVADAAATVLPFDVMTVSVVTAPDEFSVYAIVGDTADLQRTCRVEDQSPAIRVRAGEVVRIEDAERQLDPGYRLDRLLLEHGARSGVRTALVRGDQVTGAVSLWSRRSGAFTIEHETIVRSIAILLGLALDHERILSSPVPRA
jgi:transcriptional regulator with GAF, ATPase, and Fis domain